MNIPYELQWQEVSGAVSYLLTVFNATGEVTVGAGLTSTSFTVTLDDTVAAVYAVRAYDGTNYGPRITITYMPPTTMASLRTKIRRELKDPSGTKFDNAELGQYIEEAINDYSAHFPKEKQTIIALDPDLTDYQMPDDTLMIQRVKVTDNDGNSRYMKPRAYKAGEDIRTNPATYWKLGINRLAPGTTRYYSGHYEYRDGWITLDFNPETGDTMTVDYGAYYPQPVFDGVPLEVPARDEELLILYVCGKATARIEWQDANLSRWKEKGSRDDSPLELPYNKYFAAYREKIRERKSRVHILRRARG